MFSEETKDILKFLSTKEGIFSFIILVFSSYLLRPIVIILSPFIILTILAFMGLFVSNKILQLISTKECKKYVNKKPSEVAILIGADNLLTELFFSNCLGITYLIGYLKLKEKKFNIYITPSKRDFDNLLKNKNVKILYLVGHGHRRFFKLNSEDIICYSDYKNSKIIKDEIHLYHCGNGDGETLIDYLVKKENREKCYHANNKIRVFTYVVNLRELYVNALKTCK